MADNTTLPSGTGGDTIRDLARQSGTVKTQVMQLDIGGASANAEVLVTAGQQTMSASLPVVIASNQSALPISAPSDGLATGSITTVDSVMAAPGAAAISGTPTSGSYLACAVPSGANSATFQLTSGLPGSVVFMNMEYSLDSTNGVNGNWYALWVRAKGYGPGSGSGGSYNDQPTMAPTFLGMFTGDIQAATYVRVRARGTGSGSTCNVVIRVGVAAQGVNIMGGLPTGISRIGTVGLSDGTNVVAFKPASTAAAATDPALVVALSPNNGVSLNAGTNFVGLARLSDQTNLSTIKAASTAAVATDTALVVAVSPNNALVVSQSTAANLNATAAQGAPNTAANAWTAKITDGTNVSSVKAASTLAVSTDIALVTTLRDSPIPNKTATGNLTNGTDTVTLSLPDGTSAVRVGVTGTFVSGTIICQTSIDGTNYVYNSNDSIFGTGAFTIPVAGAKTFQVKFSPYISGSVAVVLTSTSGVETVRVNGSIPVSGTVGLSSLPLPNDTVLGPFSFTTAAPSTTLYINGSGSAKFSVKGTWVGTLIIEGTFDSGTTFVQLPVVPIGQLNVAPTLAAITTNGVYEVIGSPAMQGIRSRMVTYTSGTAVTYLETSAGTSQYTYPVPDVGFVSTVNSSSTVLAANAAFTGTAEDLTNYAFIEVSVFADQVSATDGLQMQQSSNGTNWDILDVYTIPASTGKTFSVARVAKFFRVVYTNGTTLQGAFRLQVIYSRVASKGSSVRPQDSRPNDNDMEEMLAYGMVFDGTNWQRARGDATNGVISQLKSGGNLATIKAASTATVTTDTALVTTNRDFFSIAASGNPYTLSGYSATTYIATPSLTTPGLVAVLTFTPVGSTFLGGNIVLTSTSATNNTNSLLGASNVGALGTFGTVMGYDTFTIYGGITGPAVYTYNVLPGAAYISLQNQCSENVTLSVTFEKATFLSGGNVNIPSGVVVYPGPQALSVSLNQPDTEGGAFSFTALGTSPTFSIGGPTANSVIADVQGTWVGALQFVGRTLGSSNDYVILPFIKIANSNGSTLASSGIGLNNTPLQPIVRYDNITENGLYRVLNTSGCDSISCNCISYTSGTINGYLYISASNNSPSQVISTPEPKYQVRHGFDSTITTGVDTAIATLVHQAGGTATTSQSAGSLVVTSGVTANAETVIRSLYPVSGDLTLRYFCQLSQRIANNNFFVELVDVIGDGLTLTALTATTMKVTIPNNQLNATNVGQSIYVGAISNGTITTAIPGRYPIASVSGNDVTFTVAGWSTSGTGTCSLFGLNYIQMLYTGTVATNINYDTQRNGYNSGFTTATINTTTSPGHIGVVTSSENESLYADQVGTSGTGAVEISRRASRTRQLPNPTKPLFLQIRSTNGTSAPASTTTLTIAFADILMSRASPVTLTNISPISANSGVPIEIINTPTMFLGGGSTLADSTANPTVAGVESFPVLWNSATWDRQRGNYNITTGDTGTKTASFSGATQTNYNARGALITLLFGTVSGTTPTFVAQLQGSPDGGTTWINIPGAVTASITATGNYSINCYPGAPTVAGAATSGNVASASYPIPRVWRVNYTIGGTTPSFALTSVSVAYIN